MYKTLRNNWARGCIQPAHRSSSEENLRRGDNTLLNKEDRMPVTVATVAAAFRRRLLQHIRLCFDKL